MGDRCYMELHCRKQDAPRFEELGFTVFHDYKNGTVEMIDEEANYAHSQRMPADVPYYGSHGSGGSYGPCVFACDGETYAEASSDMNKNVLVRCDNGVPDTRDLQRVQQYERVRAEAEQIVLRPEE